MKSNMDNTLNESVARTSQLIRVVRKSRGINQIEMAKRIGISQGTLSKIENEKLSPSVYNWYTFCEAFDIPYESYVTGFIEKGHNAMLISRPTEGYFKIPPRFSQNMGSNVKATLPALASLQAFYGTEYKDKLLRSMKLDPDYFVNLDHQIGIRFNLDIFKHMIDDGKIKKNNLKYALETVANPKTHGKLAQLYSAQCNPFDLVTTLIDHAKEYECNFTYAVEDRKADFLEFSATPGEHLFKEVFKEDSSVVPFVASYQKAYFEQFFTLSQTSTTPKNHFSMAVVDSIENGSAKSVYRISA